MDERKKRKVMKTRRFSEEQIRSLESMFEKETRLEPRKKVQVARELGLQPRQVAIWFQNKRARWRSKQLETEYGMLRANYNTLASRFGVLNKEKQALLLQLQKLSDELQESENGNRNNIEFEEKWEHGIEDDMKADYFGLGVEQEWGKMEFNHFSNSNSYQWWESIV